MDTPRSSWGADPVCWQGQPLNQQADVEDIGTIGRLLRLEQVKQQRAQARPLQALSHQTVARAQAATAAPVGEQHDALSTGRMHQRPRKAERRNRDFNVRPVVPLA
jgi:hypothetical protein